jgi:hypothetical protein
MRRAQVIALHLLAQETAAELDAETKYAGGNRRAALRQLIAELKRRRT